MDDDERCCGTGTCLINAQGVCWCGQQWDGTKMCRPAARADGVRDASDTGTKVTAQTAQPSGE